MKPLMSDDGTSGVAEPPSREERAGGGGGGGGAEEARSSRRAAEPQQQRWPAVAGIALALAEAAGSALSTSATIPEGGPLSPRADPDPSTGTEDEPAPSISSHRPESSSSVLSHARSRRSWADMTEDPDGSDSESMGSSVSASGGIRGFAPTGPLRRLPQPPAGSLEPPPPQLTLSEDERAWAEQGNPSDSEGSVSWSLGSREHASGNCRPCIFILKATGCNNGRNCPFCHYPHDSRILHRRHLRQGNRRRPRRTGGGVSGGGTSADEPQPRLSAASSRAAEVEPPPPSPMGAAGFILPTALVHATQPWAAWNSTRLRRGEGGGHRGRARGQPARSQGTPSSSGAGTPSSRPLTPGPIFLPAAPSGPSGAANAAPPSSTSSEAPEPGGRGR